MSLVPITDLREAEAAYRDPASFANALRTDILRGCANGDKAANILFAGLSILDVRTRAKLLMERLLVLVYISHI